MFDIVIPHHNRVDHLSRCLEAIPKGYNVNVIRGGTFAENCNKGSDLTCPAGDVLFLNDDCFVSAILLAEIDLLSHEYQIIGVPLTNVKCELTLGIKIRPDWAKEGKWPFEHIKRSSPDFPSGACFWITKALFLELGGFDEQYKNGCEDVDLFLKAMSKGIKICFTENTAFHFEAQSDGRYNNAIANRKILLDKYTPEILEELAK